MRFEHFKELYYKEFERKEVVNGRLQWTISIFIILTGANLYCLNLLFKLEVLQWVMILLYGCTTLGLVVSAVFLAIPLWAKKVQYLPLPQELNNYFKTLMAHYENEDEKEALVQTAYENYLIDTYVSCTEFNTKLNDRKNIMISMSNVAMIICSVFLLLAFIVIAPVAAKKDDIYKVEIIKGGEKVNE